ncbi:hypothetical protein AVEN_211960-1 [Araneus ventricosus]|uniref:Uncharacterized protein n=1 Tax=Araneus ventricosus TaxID=182803 RepID=A0A4Y2FZP7_ARAVE|nr:hypothetical protein AVEN_211960-1 [Araneus ventricosus]
MLLGIAFIIGFRNTPIEAGHSCTFAASTCCRTLRRCSYISVLGVTSCIVKSVGVSFHQGTTAVPFLFQPARNVLGLLFLLGQLPRRTDNWYADRKKTLLMKKRL